jgi:CRP/FNR family transcriptional regulator
VSRLPIPISTLRTLAVFRGASETGLKALAESGVELRFDTGEALFREGTQVRGWWVVLAGNVRVVRGAGSRLHVVHAEGTGGTLGEVPLFTNDPHPATGIATEPTTCLLWTRSALESALARDASLAFIIFRRLALRVQALVKRLDQRSAQSVQARLAEYLANLPRSAKDGSVSIGMTQRSLAEELGTVREVVGRELRALCRRGFIASRGGGRYGILNAHGLSSLAQSKAGLRAPTPARPEPGDTRPSEGGARPRRRN